LALLVLLAPAAKADVPSLASVAPGVDKALADAGISKDTFVRADFYYIKKAKCLGVTTHDFIYLILKYTDRRETHSVSRVFGLTEDSDLGYGNDLAKSGKLPTPFATTRNFFAMRYLILVANAFNLFIEDLLKNGIAAKLTAYNAMLFAPFTGRPCGNTAEGLKDQIIGALKIVGNASDTKELICQCGQGNQVILPLYSEVRKDGNDTVMVWGEAYPWVNDWRTEYFGKSCKGWLHTPSSKANPVNVFTLEVGKITGCVGTRVVLGLAPGSKSEIKAAAVNPTAPVTKTPLVPGIPDPTQASVLTPNSLTQEVTRFDAVTTSNPTLSSPIVDSLVACAALPDECALNQDTDWEVIHDLLLW